MIGTHDQFSFLTIDAKKPVEDRYSKNFQNLKNIV